MSDRAFGVERVAYAVMAQEGDGTARARLITAYRESADLALAEEAVVDEAQVQGLAAQRTALVRAEQETRQAVARIESLNTTAGRGGRGPSGGLRPACYTVPGRAGGTLGARRLRGPHP